MSDSKLLLLTGASRGIGHSTVALFLERGWRVLSCSRDTPPPECRMDSARAHHIAADLGDPDSLDRFVVEANDWLDGRPLHALVNNAGWSPKTPYKERLGCLNGDLDAWRPVFELNFFAPLKLARGFRSEEHTSELQSLMRISYAVFCLKKKKNTKNTTH